jgi:hypothetical protein
MRSHDSNDCSTSFQISLWLYIQQFLGLRSLDWPCIRTINLWMGIELLCCPFCSFWPLLLLLLLVVVSDWLLLMLFVVVSCVVNCGYMVMAKRSVTDTRTPPAPQTIQELLSSYCICCRCFIVCFCARCCVGDIVGGSLNCLLFCCYRCDHCCVVPVVASRGFPKIVHVTKPIFLGLDTHTPFSMSHLVTIAETLSWQVQRQSHTLIRSHTVKHTQSPSHHYVPGWLAGWLNVCVWACECVTTATARMCDCEWGLVDRLMWLRDWVTG